MRWRWRKRHILASALVTMECSEAMAADLRLFPASSHLVPVVVIAVFVLPAVLAGLVSTARRLCHGSGRFIALASTLATCVVGGIVYFRPSILQLIP